MTAGTDGTLAEIAETNSAQETLVAIDPIAGAESNVITDVGTSVNGCVAANNPVDDETCTFRNNGCTNEKCTIGKSTGLTE